MRSEKFVSQLDRKVKSGFLLSLMCIFCKSNGSKFWSHGFHLQNSSFLQTKMEQKGNPTKMNFDSFQIQKWPSQTVRAQKADEKNGINFYFSFFLPELLSLPLIADLSKKSKSIKAIYLYQSFINRMFNRGLSNSAEYCGLKYQKSADSGKI